MKSGTRYHNLAGRRFVITQSGKSIRILRHTHVVYNKINFMHHEYRRTSGVNLGRLSFHPSGSSRAIRRLKSTASSGYFDCNRDVVKHRDRDNTMECTMMSGGQLDVRKKRIRRECNGIQVLSWCIGEHSNTFEWVRVVCRGHTRRRCFGQRAPHIA